MSIIFGPDTFTVGANTNIDEYPSVGDPDYAYVNGSGSNMSVNATNDRVQNNVANQDSIARVIDPAVSPNMVNQEIRGGLFTQTAGNADSGLLARYATTRRGYSGYLVTASVNEVQIYEDNSGNTLLASVDRGLFNNVTYSSAFRAVGNGSGAVWLTLIIDLTEVSLTFADTATVVTSGSPALGTFGVLATDIASVDDYLVDDLAGFPLVAGIVATNGSTATTSAVVNMPSGCLAGETLIILIRATEGGTITFPNEGTDWIQLFENSADASNDTTAAAWRKASGAEGATITVALGTSGKFAAIVYRVLNAADPTTRAPEFATIVTGTSTTPDPGTVTPTGGTKKYLFIWAGGWEGEQTSPPASFPTNYNSPVGADTGIAGAVATNCRVATAHREVEASSENPGSWTISASDDWTATVIAVHPIGASEFMPAAQQLRRSGGWIGGGNI